MVKYYLLAFLIAFISCKEKENFVETDKVIKNESSFSETYRPQFHFTPPEKWMNDPNGLVYNNGVYHLFYQHYPEDIVWGPMHWGHAVSKDLIHWEHKPIALYPDELGLIFSGSAVVDKDNTSGFGTTENPPLVAIYTYHLMEGEKSGRKDFQTQGIAYSLDNGDSWAKYEGNPIIGNDGIKDFRDPKVFWDEETNQWIMVLVAGDHAKFYKSENLKDWNLMSEFGKENGAHGGVWECPDLFKMKVGDSEEEKWVLLISINPGAPNGGSGTQYFVGEFDGEQFTTDQRETKWLDYGMDNYAGVTYNNIPNNERIFIGWMSNWNYARDTPTEVWRSAMTLPRNISLHKDDDGYFLKNYPVSNFEKIKTLQKEFDTVNLNEPFILEADYLNNAEVSFTTSLNNKLSVELKNESETISLSLNPAFNTIAFDRRASGIVDFEESFGKEVQIQPYLPIEKEVEVSIIVDESSIEVFIDKGKYVFTNQLFPEKPYNTVSISGEDATLSNLKFNTINSIWNAK